MSAGRLLVGLTGAPGAGKDEVGKILVRSGWHAIAFADALRIEAATAWHVDIRTFANRAAKERPDPNLCAGYCLHPGFIRRASAIGHALYEPRSPRWVLQQWGTYRRHSNPAHWVQHVQGWVDQQHRRDCRGLVVTDVRLPNEADMLRARGGHLVRVHRPGLPPLPPDVAGHESENHTALPAETDIHNDGDLEHLQAETWRALMHIKALHITPPTGDTHHG